MGLLDKYVGYRVLTGNTGSSGGGGGFVLLMAIIFGVMLIFATIAYAFQWIYTTITTTIYTTVRPILMIAPNITTVLLGVIFASLFVKTITAYPPDTAKEILFSNNGSHSFYTAAIVGLTVLNVVLIIASDVLIVYSGDSLLLSFLIVISVPYGVYKCCQAVWRTHRLTLGAPNGRAYSLGILTVVTTAIVIDIFDIPTIYSRVFQGLWLPSIVIITALVIVKYRVEPYVLPTQTTATTSTVSSDK